MNEFIENLLTFGGKTVIKKLSKITAQVNAFEEVLSELPDKEFKEETLSLKERYSEGEHLDRLLPEAYALVREASKRVLGMRHFDVQIMGGIALHQGAIAEIKTGEGKTLVALLPAYLNSLTGNSVHIVTVNEYLAQYQSQLMSRVFNFLGLTTGCILSSQTTEEKQTQYACDVVYGTNSEFGFDYLRDNLAQFKEEQVQRGHHFVIIDEIDSILIDDARTPLVIAGPGSRQEINSYRSVARIVKSFQEGIDYESDYKKKTVSVLPPAIDKIEKAMSLSNLYAAENTFLVGALQNAIQAKALYKKDVDYVVTREGIELVDENTGRILEGRRYNDGLHQAIEAKEGVAINADDQTIASITLQNFFRLYNRISGMTGTAKTESEEFYSIYKLPVVAIPTNLPSLRIDQPELIFRTEKDKFTSVVNEIQIRHAAGQPVLVGTSSILKNEALSRLLKKAGIPHSVLNAKDDSREAEIIAQAGRVGSVTISTNMAGRGTDIMLGGNSEMLAAAELKKYKGSSQAPLFGELLEKFKIESQEEAEKVKSLGGLCVIATERHESKRIDNQLRGRAGRQGDPGESIFMVSFEDELIRKYGRYSSNTLNSIPEGGIISDTLSKVFDNAQKESELKHREERKEVVKYDNIVHIQRLATYKERQQVINGADISETVKGFIQEYLEEVVTAYISDKQYFESSEELAPLWNKLNEIYPVGITPEGIIEEASATGETGYKWIQHEIISDARIAYSRKEASLAEPVMRDIERGLILYSIDTHWKHHLNNVNALLDVIGFRGYAHEEPINAYRREANTFYNDMLKSIKEEVVETIFRVSATKSSDFLNPMGKVEAVFNPTVFKLGDSMVSRMSTPITTDFNGNLIPEDQPKAYQPMNRAERRAAAKSKKKK